MTVEGTEAANVALVEPAATLTEAGRLKALAGDAERLTVAPPAGAAWDRVTEQTALAPGERDCGEHWTAVSAAPV